MQEEEGGEREEGDCTYEDGVNVEGRDEISDVYYEEEDNGGNEYVNYLRSKRSLQFESQNYTLTMVF